MREYEIVDHTADVGVRAWGRTPEELYVHMAEGMFSLIVGPEEVRERKTVRVEARGQGEEGLLVAWLRELLFLFDTQHFVAKAFRIDRLEPGRVEAQVSGEKLDLSRHSPGREVKAVTYCDLAVTHQPDGTWVSQVIFDI